MSECVLTPFYPDYFWIEGSSRLFSSSLLIIFCFPFTPRVISAAAFTASCHSLSFVPDLCPRFNRFPNSPNFICFLLSGSLLMTFFRWSFVFTYLLWCYYCRSLTVRFYFFLLQIFIEPQPLNLLLNG